MDIDFPSPDLEAYRLNASFGATQTIQFGFALDNGSHQTRQIWKRARALGSGSFGRVWQERLDSEGGDTQYRAVKVCSQVQMQRSSVNYRRELVALTVLSRSHVRSMRKFS